MSPTALLHDPRRIVALEAAHNVRDLGGYALGDGRTIAWGRLLRGDGLHHLTAADLDALAPLGLRTVIDLRTGEEIALRGTFPVERHPVELVHHPILDATWNHDDVPRFADDQHPDAAFLAWAYRRMLDHGAERFAAAVASLTRPDALPAIFHCAAGKDRTGVLAALVLAALGVDEGVIVGDYGLTASGLARMQAWLHRHFPDRAAALAETPSAFRAADPEAMAATLEHVRRAYGSAAEYLAAGGLEPTALPRLADALTRATEIDA